MKRHFQPSVDQPMDMTAHVASGRYRIDPIGTQEWADYALSVRDQSLQVAEDRATGQHVLLRSVAIDATASPQVRLELLRAARSATTFRHPALLPLLDVAEAEGRLIFVQPLPQGLLLRHTVEGEGAYTWATAQSAMRPFLEAVAAAREAGFNIPLISPQDFALASPEEDSRGQLISLAPPVPLGWTLQTAAPAFIPPGELEDFDGSTVGAIYSVGAVLSYMMAGRTPEPEETWPQLLTQLDLPAQVRPILLSMLEREPVLRPREASHIVQWLDAIATQAFAPQRKIKTRPRPSHALFSAAVRRAPAAIRNHRLKALALAAGVPLIAFFVREALDQPGHSASFATSSSAPTQHITAAQPALVTAESAELSEETTSTASPALLVADYRPKASPAALLSVEHLNRPVSLSRKQLMAATLGSVPAATRGSIQLASLSLTEEHPRKVALRRPATINPAREDAAQLAFAQPIPRAIPVAIPIAEPYHPTTTTSGSTRITVSAAPSLVLASLAPAEPPTQSPGRSIGLSPHDQVAQLMRGGSLSEAQRATLRAQAQRLKQNGDPMGDNALGYVMLHEAEVSPRLSDCSSILARAILLLKRATATGQPKAASHLIQACLNKYNLERQAGHRSAAERASRDLSSVLSYLPNDVPARELNQLAAQIDHTLDLREKQGHPHPQASYNRTIALALRTLAEDR